MSKLIPRPIEQAACRADLGAGDDAAGLDHAAIRKDCGSGPCIMRMPR
jgi:hypothetical protein